MDIGKKIRKYTDIIQTTLRGCNQVGGHVGINSALERSFLGKARQNPTVNENCVKTKVCKPYVNQHKWATAGLQSFILQRLDKTRGTIRIITAFTKKLLYQFGLRRRTHGLPQLENCHLQLRHLGVMLKDSKPHDELKNITDNASGRRVPINWK